MQNKTRNASLPLGSGGSSSGGSNPPIPKRRYFHYAIFVALLVSSFFNLQTLWGLFFIGLTIPAYLNREVFFLDIIERDKEPVFYWAVLLVWISLGVLMVLMDVPLLAAYLQ